MQSSNTIVIVARNNCHLTKKAVETALAQDVPVKVVVVDNASSDGTADWLKTKPEVCRITFQEQRSLAACWNYALKMLFRHDTMWHTSRGVEHVLVINNDVELRPDTYRELLRHGGPFVTAVSVGSMEQLYPLVEIDENGPTKEPAAPRPHPDFSCFLIRKTCWDKVGPFDEKYWPAFCEDLDYHIRMHKAGFPAVCIDLPFLHHGSATVKHADLAERNKILRGADENREYFRHKWGVKVGSPEYYAIFQSGDLRDKTGKATLS